MSRFIHPFSFQTDTLSPLLHRWGLHVNVAADPALLRWLAFFHLHRDTLFLLHLRKICFESHASDNITSTLSYLLSSPLVVEDLSICFTLLFPRRLSIHVGSPSAPRAPQFLTSCNHLTPPKPVVTPCLGTIHNNTNL